jgi:hypothetical protein
VGSCLTLPLPFRIDWLKHGIDIGRPAAHRRRLDG